MISVCTNELNGDVLWTVPAVRALAERHGCKVDYWLGPRGSMTADLLKSQSFIRDAFCGYGRGIANYDLNFKDRPADKTLLDYFCALAGVPRQGHFFELPADCPSEPIPDGPFVVLAAKRQDGSMHERWGEMWREFVRRCPLPVVEVGCPGAATATDCGAMDRLRHGFLEMAGIISKCKYFFGHISAPLVIADAMPDVVRIAVHDGGSWNLKACTQSPMNHYPVCYDAGALLEYIK
jgi:hypothetical protein